jgi:D-alanyl-D-alanine carboxypeptidase
MSCRGARGRRGLHWGTVGLAALLAVATAADGADARSRRHHHRSNSAAERYQPPYSSIVVDANSGAVMQAMNADSPRHPASLTKIMTLYLLFERLEAGKIKLSTDMSVSPHAAAQAPSKLGLKPGQTIAVETAIRAIVTKSANDVAVIVAEALASDESEFARQMTAKAHALGMGHTTYRNASGLPDDQQITTARDQAILGRAIQDRFPKYYHYFSTQTFAFHGKVMRNHNHLLGHVAGVDGIKTGYIHDSGFNIVTSVRRNGRHVVAVVFGGRTAEARDARVRSMIDNNINVAARKRTAPPVVEGWETAQAGNTRAKSPIAKIASAIPLPPPAPATTASIVPPPAPGSTAPIKPNPVKTIVVQGGVIHTASLSQQPPASQLSPGPAVSNYAKVTTVTTAKNEPLLDMPPSGAQAGAPGLPPASRTAKAAHVASASTDVPHPDSAPERTAKPRGPWMIQVGAFDDENDARQRLAAAKAKAMAQLGDAAPYTERVAKGEKSLYRARFAGLDKSQAEIACKHLKRSEIPCMLLKN